MTRVDLHFCAIYYHCSAHASLHDFNCVSICTLLHTLCCLYIVYTCHYASAHHIYGSSIAQTYLLCHLIHLICKLAFIPFIKILFSYLINIYNVLIHHYIHNVWLSYCVCLYVNCKLILMPHEILHIFIFICLFPHILSDLIYMLHAATLILHKSSTHVWSDITVHYDRFS